MRILADENFPRLLVEVLRKDGHDVLWARTDCAGWRDVRLLEFAESEARIVLTSTKTSGKSPSNAVSRSNSQASCCFVCTPRHRKI